MKPFKSILSLLTLSAVVLSVPLAFSQFKKVNVNPRTIDTSVVSKIGKSPYMQPMPPARANSTVSQGGITMRGLVLNSDESYIGEFTVGEDLTVTEIQKDYYFDASGNAFYADGKFYMQYIYSESMGVDVTGQLVYDAETWELLEERGDLLPSSTAACITYDPLDCAAYGYFRNDDNDPTWLMYGRMNLATGEVLGINNVDENDGFMCIAASPDGWLYGVDLNGQFCRIDKKTGVITVLGHTDIKPYYLQSAVIDWETGKFYWAGMTDMGESSLYEIDPQTYMAKKIGDFPQNQEFVGLYIVEDRPAGEIAAEVEQISLSFDKASLNGKVSFKAPSGTTDGSALKGAVKAHVAVDGNHFEADATPGAECSVDVTVSTNGLYMFTAWVSDENGDGQKATAQKWIGLDQPGEVPNINLVNDNGHLTLTWDAPSTEGIHGGYVDLEKVTYTIGRDGGGYMKPIHGYTGFKYEMDMPENTSDNIRFYVRAVLEEIAGPVAYSNEVFVGKVEGLEPPQKFNAAEIDKFVVIDGNNDGVTWEQNWGGFATCDRGATAPGDDWILTPSLSLKKDMVYELSYEVSADMGFFSPQIIDVKMGVGETAADMTFDIDNYTVTSLRLTQFETRTVSFTAPSDGNFRIGFHAVAKEDGTVGLSGINIKSLSASAGPAAPESMLVVPAADGSLVATIEFVAPSEDNNGDPIEELAKIEVFKDQTLVGSVENPVPGTKYSVEDKNAVQGTNQYEVVATDKGGTAGMKGKVEGWVGIDIPQTPENVNMVERGTDLVITWTLPEKGMHGGFVDPAEVVYVILEPTYMMELGSVKGVNEAVISLGEVEKQGSYTLGVASTNVAGTSGYAALTPTVIAGPAHTLPFFETFPGGKVDYSWHVKGEYMSDDGGWSPVADKGPDGQPGVSTFWGIYEEETQSLVSGKISLKDATDPTLQFYLFGNVAEDAYGVTFTVSISESFTTGFKEIYTKEFAEPGVSDWAPVEISLAEYVGKDIYIDFNARPVYGSVLIGIDDISIRNAVEYDASIEGITIDTDEVEVGVSTAKVGVRVQNHGVKDFAAGSYKVGFYAGERQFALLDGQEMAAKWGQTLYEAEFTPSVDDADPTIITARIESDIDVNPDNDLSKEVSVYVVKPERPEVDDLAGESIAEGIKLTWTQPDQSGLPVREVLDDFESYRTFDVNRAGDWTIIDEDQAAGCRTSYFFPGSAGPMGWVVMEPAAIPRGDGGTNADRFPAYSGEKMMVSYNPGTGDDNKDWLITPELSGRAHEISFMARAESAKQGREMFEVYYSTTGNQIADMVRLDNIDYRTELEGWSEFKFQIPEGAKYFAVRCVSHGRLCMHIDDFKYESTATPLEVKFIGYNVYRDGSKLNTEPLTSASYLDTTAGDGESHTYTVRVVYDRGESAHSNEVYVAYSGIDGVHVDGNDDGQYYDLYGRKLPEGVTNTIVVKQGQKIILK